MKATTSTPNALFLALWSQGQGSIVLGNLRTETGMETVIEDKGTDPFALLAATMDDAQRLCANHIIVFTNDKAVAETFTFPVHLEPKSADRMHLYNPAHWDILRAFCLYESWQVIATDKLPKAKAFWEETYGTRN